MEIPKEKGAQGMNKEQPKKWEFKGIPDIFKETWDLFLIFPDFPGGFPLIPGSIPAHPTRSSSVPRECQSPTGREELEFQQPLEKSPPKEEKNCDS